MQTNAFWERVGI